MPSAPTRTSWDCIWTEREPCSLCVCLLWANNDFLFLRRQSEASQGFSARQQFLPNDRNACGVNRTETGGWGPPTKQPQEGELGVEKKEGSSASPSSHVLTESQEQFLGLQALAHAHHTHCICAVTFSLDPWSWHNYSPASCATWQFFLPAEQSEFPSLQKAYQLYPPSPCKWSHLPSSPSQTLSSCLTSYRKSSQVAPLIFLFTALTTQSCSLKLVSFPHPHIVNCLRTASQKIANVC